MSLLQRFLGIETTGSSRGAAGETTSVRRIAETLEQMPPDQARYIAAFAYILARVAQADLTIDAQEVAAMREILRGLGRLSEEEAAVVCEIACDQSTRLGGSQNYLVTREFRAITDAKQRAQLVECLFAVAAADGEISTTESQEVVTIAEELGFTRPEALGIRALYQEHLAEFRGLTDRSA